MSPRCSRLSSTPSPIMPSFFVMDGPTKSGVSSRMESGVNLASSRSSGRSTVGPVADNAFVLRNGRADQVGGQLQDGVGSEFGLKSLFGQIHTIAGDPRKADFELVAVGAHGLHLDGFARRLHRSDDRFCGEIERYPQHVRVLHVELVVFVEFVGLAAKRAANDLFTEKLRTESAHAKDMGYRVSVPAFR